MYIYIYIVYIYIYTDISVHAHAHTYRLTYIQTYRHSDSQPVSQAGRQTDRQTWIHGYIDA